jgi:putative heme-binding domain-containing protein
MERQGRPAEKLLTNDQLDALGKLVGEARKLMADDSAPEEQRIGALSLLGRHTIQRKQDVAMLGKQLQPRNSATYQGAIVATLARIDDPAVPGSVLDGWKSHSPTVRGQILDVLLSRDAWLRQLLAAVEKRDIQPADVDAARRQRLLQHKDAVIRERAVKLLAAAVNPDRQKVVEEYQSALSLAGDRGRGKTVFTQRCATCHLLDGVGHAVGPDLAQMQNKAASAFLIAILDPNQAVDPRYVQYLAATKSGRQHTGILVGETATSITLKEQDGKDTSLLRSELEALESTGKSLMPEGLEKDISKQEMADLIAYLGEKGPAAKKVAGNTPAVVAPEKDGSLRLLATTCEIYGGEITFEPEFKNIGMWHGEHDHVAWTMQVKKAGRYDVYLDWACDNASAGNTLLVECGSEAFKHRVGKTGGWDKYQRVLVGQLKMAPGTQRLTLRPHGPLQGALLDLRGMLLVPEGAQPTTDAKKPEPKTAVEIVGAILDDTRPQAEREKLIADNPALAAEVVAEMTRGLKPGKEEYRRIPWIWRVAIAAGKRNDAAQIRSMLDITLPAVNAPLRHWQAVVLGGGLANGLTQVDVWPSERLADLLKTLPGGLEKQRTRWLLTMGQAAAMADDESVPAGTRYDALRILGLEPWQVSGKRLTHYLAKGTNDELQMGAISALGDMKQDSTKAATALRANLGHFSKSNRELALDALVRDEARIAVLLDAVGAGQVKAAELGAKRLEKIEAVKDAKLRALAHELLK